MPRHSSSPQLERVRLFEAMVAMLEWAARRRPCLLLFEDIHTADPASLELIGYVARRLPRLRMLIVLTRRDPPARPEVDSLLHRLPRRGIPAVAPLAADDMRNLVRAAASLVPDQLERVVTLAEGNPLLALEAARAIAAGRGDLAESLRGVVRGAAADLDDKARLLAELVSVAARDIDPAELERLPTANPAGAASAAIETGLLVSRSRRLAYRHALRTSPDAGHVLPVRIRGGVQRPRRPRRRTHRASGRDRAAAGREEIVRAFVPYGCEILGPPPTH